MRGESVMHGKIFDPLFGHEAFSYLQRVKAIPENVENPNLERQRNFRPNFRFMCSFEKQSKYVQVFL